MVVVSLYYETSRPEIFVVEGTSAEEIVKKLVTDRFYDDLEGIEGFCPINGVNKAEFEDDNVYALAASLEFLSNMGEGSND